MKDKERIERHVTKAFLVKTRGELIDDNHLVMGNPQKKEPDVLYQEAGFEVGAVLKGLNTHIDNYEKNFLEEANKYIRGRIPTDIQIGLVMQDDKDTVKHTPAPGFEEYPILTCFLDGVFLYKATGATVEEQVVLNQRTRLRTAVFPSITNRKEFGRFADELTRFVNSVPETEFQDNHFNTGKKIYHTSVTKGEVVKDPAHPLYDFVSPKIIDKLSKQKYEGTFSNLFLLLHNYSMAGNTELTSDMNFYSHHRNDIFNLLFEQIQANESLKYYNGIFFLDYSAFMFNKNFNLIDFSTYEERPQSKFLTGYDEICIPIKGKL